MCGRRGERLEVASSRREVHIAARLAFAASPAVRQCSGGCRTAESTDRRAAERWSRGVEGVCLSSNLLAYYLAAATCFNKGV